MQIPGQNEQNSIPRDQIDQLNPITLLKKPQQFKKSFEHMINLSSICFKKKQIQRSIKALMKCLDMLDLNKNAINIGISKFSKVCILYNLAYSYQMLQKLQKCNRFCQRSQQQFQLLLSNQNTKQQYLFITKIYLILKFQNCAILSQLQQHQKALNMCKSTIPLLEKYIKTLLDYSQQQSFKINSIQQSKVSCISQFNSAHLSSTGNTKTQKVGFYKEVYGFAQQILQSLLTNIQMQTSKMPKCPFYYWQQNPKQNQQQVKKMFIGARKQLEQQSNCKKSILGVNRNKHWIDQFSIGSIMHMSEIKINSFQQKTPIQQFLFKDKLFQVVIYCSLSQFTMATQLRFIESSKQKPKQQIIKDNNNNKIIQQKKSQIIMKKYGCQQRSELFKISQLHHFKSIEIMAKNIKTMVPFLTHIIKSYQKHYIKDKMLQPIVAIPDQSLRSIDQSRRQYLQSPENHNFGSKINLNDDNRKNAFNKKSNNNNNINKQLILPAQLVDDIKQQQYDDSQQQQKKKQSFEQINQQKLIKYRKQKSIIGIQQPLKKSQIYGMIDNQQFLLKSINRHKSAGRLKPKKKSIQKTKPSDINNPNSNRQKKKKIITNLRHFDSQKQLRIKQHSTIQIKFMYKNKK